MQLLSEVALPILRKLLILENVKRNFGNFEYIHLSDTGGIYEVSNSPDLLRSYGNLASDKVTEIKQIMENDDWSKSCSST